MRRARTHTHAPTHAHTHTHIYIYMYIIGVQHFTLIVTVVQYFGSAYFALPYQGYLAACGLDPTIKCIVSVGTRCLEGITDTPIRIVWFPLCGSVEPADQHC
jgi:hypothetical protein